MDDPYARGRDFLGRDEYGAAVEAFRLAAEKDRKCPYTQIYFAWSQYLDLRERMSVPDGNTFAGRQVKLVVKQHKLTVQRALFRAPEFVPGYIFVARILLDENDARRAVFALEKGLRQDSDHAEAIAWLSHARARMTPGIPVPPPPLDRPESNV